MVLPATLDDDQTIFLLTGPTDQIGACAEIYFTPPCTSLVEGKKLVFWLFLGAPTHFFITILEKRLLPAKEIGPIYLEN